MAVAAGADLAGFVLAAESPRRAARVLDVPDTVLSVAVHVGEASEDGADLVQLYGRVDGHRSREATLLRDGAEVARVLDLPWEGEDPEHHARAAEATGPDRARREARAGQRRRGGRARPSLGGGRVVAARDGARV